METRRSKRRSRKVAGAAIAAGVVVLIAGGVTLATALHHDSAGAAAAESAGTLSSGGISAHSSSASKSGSASGTHGKTHLTALPNPTGHSTRVPIANPAGAPCIPRNLNVAGVGIDESVVPMGTNAQGQIYPPPHTTLWYDRSAQPGQDGIAVIAGHVTYDGPDNFYNLRNVEVGTRVTITCANAKVVKLTVTGMQSIPKPALTTDQRVWGASATPVVTLVTCDIKSPMIAGHHLNNFVVWAKPMA
ncbi:class F sortase [Flexivirga caeni]|uniref:Class F sortase n=1 Tax=Flexivirga caeni TaxID=2294115 RepID=A0A3M9MJV6_9MICO|nr:class F sortase [Flexivirga caeni]RNI25455.1 class F sortase [Flexivirga caeni]